MNEQEQIELLKQVAECAPKELDCAADPDEVMLYQPGFDMPLNFAKCDKYNAQAIIAMLDAMDFLDTPFGPAVLVEVIGSKHLSPDVEPSKAWVCRRMVCPESDSPHTTAEGYGATRAEAVARAFVAVFGGKS